MGKLEDEVVMVMLGLTDPNDFINQLTKDLNLDQPKAEAVSSDVAQEIMLPIREAMQKFMEEQSAKEKPDLTTNPPTVEKSVVMPSTASKPINTPSPIPALKTTTPVSAPASTSTPKLIEIHAADLMLNEPTVSMAPKTATPAVSSAPTAPAAPTSTAPAGDSSKAEPPKPAPYKADPYREPPE